MLVFGDSKSNYSSIIDRKKKNNYLLTDIAIVVATDISKQLK